MTVRVIDVRERVMARNDEIAATVRQRVDAEGVLALNLVRRPARGRPPCSSAPSTR